MLLDSCPICQLIQSHNCEQFGQHCVSLKYNDDKTVALLKHDIIPTNEEIDEAMQMIGLVGGLISDTGVPGHWAVSVKLNNWTSEGKSVGHQESRS